MTLDQRRIDYAMILQHTPAVSEIFELDTKGQEILQLGRAGLFHKTSGICRNRRLFCTPAARMPG